MHDFCPFACELRPAGFGLGILLESAIGDFVEFEIHLSEAVLGGAAYREGLAAKRDLLGAINKGLLPDGDEGGVQSGRVVYRGHAVDFSAVDLEQEDRTLLRGRTVSR